MLSGWRYRLAAVIGAALLTYFAVLAANVHAVQAFFTSYTPLFWRLEPMLLTGNELVFAVVLNAAVVLVVLWPLYKPRPRRVLDTIFLAQKRVIVAVFALATLGYFNYSYRLPRTTLAITGGLLFVSLPVWFVWIRQRANGGADRVVLFGDDPDQIQELLETVELPFVGYCCPARVERALAAPVMVADGGHGVSRLGGLSRIEEVLVEYDIDTAVLAFEETDRGEFFGALDACYDHGVGVKVHRRFADTVLVAGDADGDVLVDVAIEPWDPQDYVIKRAFDVVFSVVGLVVLAPVILVIGVAIKFEDGGPVLYSQERTAGFGESFAVYKFRTMVENAEAGSGPRISEEDAGGLDPRVTRVGRVLRQTHLDEIPQLWSILIGDMSVVGPRPERPELESSFHRQEIDWQKRWFVKPGLTGLAQINDVTGHEPDQKLRYDLEYVRRQSFWLDMKIVLRQIWKVVRDFQEIR